ncbi:MAG: hypothetical protein KGP08_01340 [Xanthomonadaceae bacterium]|nr:hypothetical protein [Xanthomonadaceae bacterium]MDE1885813.1 hypothetical protein [Xanthomonadaceae bacterium]MDE1961476.1 hypothetical protein [Xanthomonadaceae bacterium]MDE2258544.1 hypothetical protein [Xanthomonadaceae bacterium]
MHSFEEIRSSVQARHTLRINDPYLLCFDLALDGGNRHQGLYLAEIEGEDGRKFLRVSTPIGALAGMDAKRCLRFNWEQRVGYLAVSDLDGAPYLHLCENRPYELLTAKELMRLIDEIGPLGDRLEKAMSAGGDAL